MTVKLVLTAVLPLIPGEGKLVFGLCCAGVYMV